MSLQLQIDRVLAGRPAASVELKLQLGCGANVLPDWINTDSAPGPTADYVDFNKRLPFVDDLFAAVFLEHTIEHVSKAEARSVVAEVFRILRPGGWFRLVTPSLENLARMVVEPQAETSQRYLAWFRQYSVNPAATLADAVNLIFYGHGHRHIYSSDDLADVLRSAGFVDIRSMAAGIYAHRIFRGVDGHGRVIGDAINGMEAFAIEAAKPAVA